MQVSQLNARVALERLHRHLALRSDARRGSPRLPTGLASQARRLLRLSASMRLEEKESAYIQRCLTDCQ